VRDVKPEHTAQELREWLDIERTMSAISRAFVDCDPDGADACIEDALAHIARLTDADRAFVLETTDAGHTFEFRNEWCRAGVPSRSSGSLRRLPAEYFPGWWARIGNREHILIPRVADLPPGTERDRLQSAGAVSLAAAPMMCRNEPRGLVGIVTTTEERAFSPRVMYVLEQVGALVMAALERRAAEEDRRQSEDAMRASEERFRRLVHNSADVTVVIDGVGTFTYVSPQITGLLGYEPEELVGRSSLELLHPDAVDEVVAGLATTAEGTDGSVPVGLTLRSKDGEWVETEVMAASMLEDPTVAGIIVNMRDMRESNRAATALEELEIRFRQVFDHAPIGMAIVTPDGTFVDVNAELANMLGYTTDELLHKRWIELTHPDDLGISNDNYARLLAGETDNYSVEKRYVRKDGTTLWVRVSVTAVMNAHGRPVFCIGHYQDITERKAIEQRIAYEATHDTLTRLPLRKLLLDHLELALCGRGRREGDVAVLFIDLDRFKHVNDSLGHAAGDELLIQVADRLRRAVRMVDTPGRFGGDEFVVVCPEVGGVSAAVAIAQRIRELLEAPFCIRGMDMFIGASIGIALAGAGADDAATLLAHADAAAYRAKERGRNRVEIFDDDLRSFVAHRLDVENGLRHAIDHGELRLLYQPVVTIDGGRVVGLEGLVRWERDGRLVPPIEFLPVADDSGLIVPIGQFVLDQACNQAARVRATVPGATLPVGINVSARELSQPDYATQVHDALRRYNLPPIALGFEVSEMLLMQDTPQVIDTISRLQAAGHMIAIDDFGTGSSSLRQLRRIPFRAVKIDRSFILELSDDHEGAMIVGSVVSLARALGMQVIAEGVETADHATALLALGCDRAQGYLFAPPVSADEALAMVANGVVPGRAAAA
jgi:diguanylate cyclase (GGDEF)-like protein/PAS domain S-box-containing protein